MEQEKEKLSWALNGPINMVVDMVISTATLFFNTNANQQPSQQSIESCEMVCERCCVAEHSCQLATKFRYRKMCSQRFTLYAPMIRACAHHMECFAFVLQDSAGHESITCKISSHTSSYLGGKPENEFASSYVTSLIPDGLFSKVVNCCVEKTSRKMSSVSHNLQILLFYQNVKYFDNFH